MPGPMVNLLISSLFSYSYALSQKEARQQLFVHQTLPRSSGKHRSVNPFPAPCYEDRATSLDAKESAVRLAPGTPGALTIPRRRHAPSSLTAAAPSTSPLGPWRLLLHGAGMVMNDLPSDRKPLPYQREHAANITLVSLQMPASQHQRRVRPQETELQL